MYAIVNSGGKQYRVEQGETFRIEKIPGDVGAMVSFDKVLMFSDGATVKVGNPFVENATVSAKIIEQDKARKVLVFKFKRRKGYRRKNGHRQAYTAVKIDSIKA
jgi:large subunit ribosomal protein L21